MEKAHRLSVHRSEGSCCGSLQEAAGTCADPHGSTFKYTLAQYIVEPPRETYKGPGDQSCLSLGETSPPYPKGSCGVNRSCGVPVSE
jgi:hypothetical protein